jgi:hypothetical protein
MRLLCSLFGHRLGPVKVVLALEVRVCQLARSAPLKPDRLPAEPGAGQAAMEREGVLASASLLERGGLPDLIPPGVGTASGGTHGVPRGAWPRLAGRFPLEGEAPTGGLVKVRPGRDDYQVTVPPATAPRKTSLMIVRMVEIPPRRSLMAVCCRCRSLARAARSGDLNVTLTREALHSPAA